MNIPLMIALLFSFHVPATQPNFPKAVSSVLARETTCMAEVIAYEAPDESYAGKLAVATVVQNRVNSKFFPHTVCAVVYQHGKKGCQFSWSCRSHHITDWSVYREAERIAKDVLERGVLLKSIGNATHFYNASIADPSWSHEMRFVQKIGAHSFYAYSTRTTRN